MFRPLECFVGLRYLRSRRHRGVMSFMSSASLLGIGLGVTALIVILSIINGIETETRSRLLALTNHLGISAPAGGLDNWPALAERVADIEGVAGVAPQVTLEAMLAAGGRRGAVVVRGIDPVSEDRVTDLSSMMDAGSVDALDRESGGVLLGRVLAVNLGVEIGDRINLAYPQLRDGQLRANIEPFHVSGMFSAGISQHDTGLAFISLPDASRLLGLDGRPEGLSVWLDEPMQYAAVRSRLEAELGDSFEYTDWTEVHGGQFRAVQLEKTMLTVIMMLIVGVAAFNIVASLMMLVTEKRRDIAILRTYGLEPGRVARIFLVQGAVLGLAGSLGGVIAGVFLALNVESIVYWLERTFGFQIMPGDVYYISAIPSEVHAADVIIIGVVAFLVATVATIYPARRASAISPADALRSD